MKRFFVSEINPSREFLITDPAQIHHIKDVLRLRPKQAIVLFDALGNEYECLIKSVEPKKIVVMSINLKKKADAKDISAHITLACAIPKKSKFDTIVEKATELGVDAIIPMETARSIVRFKGVNSGNKLARWRRIAIEAVKQCARPTLPKIENVQKFEDVAKRFEEFDSILMPNLSFRLRLPIIKAAEGLKSKKRILLLIGPEGDFSQEELGQAKAKNAIMITLGKTVLRVETAAIVCVGLLNFLLKE